GYSGVSRKQVADFEAWQVGVYGWNGPRTSPGASGFRSTISICEGPAAIQSRMTDFRGRVEMAPADRRNPSTWDNESPPTASRPTSNRPRRLITSASSGCAETAMEGLSEGDNGQRLLANSLHGRRADPGC
ncbi:MAG: hypothetical protein RLZZ536_2506, partial [Planctomycetota bacterium]